MFSFWCRQISLQATVRLCAGGIIDIRLPVTVAKFINNCSLSLLSFISITSDETIAETCTTADY
jgi:hypothetical protein